MNAPYDCSAGMLKRSLIDRNLLVVQCLGMTLVEQGQTAVQYDK